MTSVVLRNIFSTFFSALFVFVAGTGCTVDFSGSGSEGTDGSVFCGNNVAETGESCDGADLAGQTCQTLGLGPGVVSCEADCQGYDTTGCGLPGCGDGVRVGNETCDGTDLFNETCVSQGFAGGELGCAEDCQSYDTTGCERVGDFLPCTEDEQCQGRTCWTEETDGWPAGFCTEDCLLDPGSCPDGMCLEVAAGQYRCFQACLTTADCREGYACYIVGSLTGAVCYPACTSDALCPDTGTCNPWTGTCTPVGTAADNGLPCGVPTDCKGGMCRIDYEGGYCVSNCALSMGICPGDGVCVDAYGGNQGDLGQCHDGCTEVQECRAGYQCFDPGPPAQKYCVPITP